jgi:hypothetical protein
MTISEEMSSIAIYLFFLYLLHTCWKKIAWILLCHCSVLQVFKKQILFIWSSGSGHGKKSISCNF